MAVPFVFRRLLRLGEGLADRLVCLAGALAAGQGPEFIQQYRQRLGGHLDEARRQLARFEELAAQAQEPLAQFIARTARNADHHVARLADVMQEAVNRVDALAAAHDALAAASMWGRPWVFVQHLDLELARATWALYRPALPITGEGLVYALAGLAAAWLLWQGVFVALLQRLGRPWSQARGPAAVGAPSLFHGQQKGPGGEGGSAEGR